MALFLREIVQEHGQAFTERLDACFQRNIGGEGFRRVLKPRFLFRSRRMLSSSSTEQLITASL